MLKNYIVGEQNKMFGFSSGRELWNLFHCLGSLTTTLRKISQADRVPVPQSHMFATYSKARSLPQLLIAFLGLEMMQSAPSFQESL